MNKKVLISIIMPIYNAEEYLDDSIQSILSQKEDNYELLLIDDGSVDNSLKIIKKYEKENKNIRVISRKNKGILKTRLEGIENAIGEYIMFVDADDRLPSNVLSTYLKYLSKKKYDIIRGNYELISDKKYIKKIEFDSLKEVTKEHYEEKVYLDFLTGPKYNSIWRTLVKKDLFKLYSDIMISMGDDQALVLSTLNNSNNILLIPDIVYSYRINESSITNTKNIEKKCRNYDDIYELYNKIIIPFFINLDNKNLLKKAYTRYLRDCNMNFFDIYKVCGYKKESLKYQDKLFDSKLTIDAREILNKGDIKTQKTYYFIKSVLDNNKKRHIRLIRLLKLIR